MNTAAKVRQDKGANPCRQLQGAQVNPHEYISRARKVAKLDEHDERVSNADQDEE